MGVYLSEPETSKQVQEGGNNKISFCCAEMQGMPHNYSGWRKNMEDAAIHQLDIGDGNSVFAVFDGHGGNTLSNSGAEVSKFVSQIFVKELMSHSSYAAKKY